MNKSFIYLIIGIVILVCGTFLFSCSGDINTNYDPHFTKDGAFIPDSTIINFEQRVPSSVKFYVEVSGSMNGFFRANRPTNFKTDIWSILTAYSNLAPSVTVLTNDGKEGANMPLGDFRNYMNTGAFVSSASTKVPVMLETIIDNLKVDDDEVAVLVSDMKYSPVGAYAPEVLMSQYSSDISHILGKYGKSISVICAISDYLDKNGNIVTNRSPYYFVILGNQENVALVRNHISSLLKLNTHFIDNIDSGFDFGSAKYSFGIPRGAIQLNGQPTFVNYQNEGGECKIKLRVDLSDFRWLLSDEEVFESAFKVKSLYGSKVEVGDIDIQVKDITGEEKLLKRESIAEVELYIREMPLDSDVIEWNIDIPSTNFGAMEEFFWNASDENDPTKSYSVPDFLRGVFQGALIVKDLKPNYILVSKNQ